MDELNPVAFSVRFNTINNLDVFVKRTFKELVIDNLIQLKKDYSINVYGYLIMTDQIGLVIAPENKKDLNLFCERFKQNVSQKIMELLEGDSFTEKRWLLFLVNFINKDNSEAGSNKIWNLDYAMKPLHNSEEIEQELDELYKRPIEQGVVTKAEDYNFSSCKENAVEVFFLNREAV